VHEVYDYKRATDPLFAGYINTFLKLKMESTGWPKEVKNEEEKTHFVEQYLEKEDVQLDPAKMVKNSALRTLAKLCLNSFWGKFGQRENLPIAQYFTKPEEYFNVVFDVANQLQSVRIISAKMMLVNYIKEEEFIETVPTVNAVIAAFVTAQARLKLYSYIEKLQERVLYFDTDSIIYLTRPGDV
jgi:hypothetical protein